MATIHKNVKVWFGRTVIEIPTMLVAGNSGLNEKDGILGIYMDKDSVIHIFAGDDGKWWQIYSFHRHWLKEFLFIFKEFERIIDDK
jgi:hypothetical protein